MKRLTGLILCAAFAPAQAEIITMPGGPKVERPGEPVMMQEPSEVDRSGLPQRGMLKDQVRSRYGEPQTMSPPVGDPPISRWVYNDFTVFFEYQHVISAVIPEKPRKIYNQNELRPALPGR